MNSHGLIRENLVATLPPALRKDPSVVALAEAMSELLAQRVEEIDRLRIYPSIEQLDEKLLDILAHDFKVDWWDADYSAEKKRNLLKSNWKVHRTLGTKAAVEAALSDVYPKTTVQEWFEYGGSPHHFRAVTTNPAIAGTDRTDFRRVLDIVKRLSAWMDEYIFLIQGSPFTHKPTEFSLRRFTQQLTFSNVRRACVRFDGKRLFDGSLPFDQQPAGISFPRFILSSRFTNSRRGRTVRFDGEARFDGSICFDQSISGVSSPAFGLWTRFKNHRKSELAIFHAHQRFAETTVRLSMPALRILARGKSIQRISQTELKMCFRLPESKRKPASLTLSVGISAKHGKEVVKVIAAVFSLPFAHTHSMSAALTTDSWWTLDGSALMDGSRKFNAGIIKEEL